MINSDSDPDPDPPKKSLGNTVHEKNYLVRVFEQEIFFVSFFYKFKSDVRYLSSCHCKTQSYLLMNLQLIIITNISNL